MREVYIFSNVIGTFVFDEHIRLVKKKELANKELARIEDGLWTAYERELVDTFSKKTVYYLGYKEEPYNDAIVGLNNDKLSSILDYFRKDDQKFLSGSTAETKSKIKNSVTRDILIIQAISSIEEVDKTINLLSKRVREWYSYYLPELSRNIADHEDFVDIVSKEDRKSVLVKLGLKEEDSMGFNLKRVDVVPIINLAVDIKKLYFLKKKQTEYLETITEDYCPNLHKLLGSTITAKLISISGSLKHLSQFPASTLQLLGAEKALFRHLKTGSRPPKYGVIVNHQLISTAKASDKGRMARILADKASIAARVDFFKGNYIADKLIREINKKKR